MSNPLIDVEGFSLPHMGTDTGVSQHGYAQDGQCAPQLAMLILLAFGFIVLLRQTGFRAMIAVGR